MGAQAKRSIFCCACARDVDAQLTNGAECYPHRPDLAGLPFWRCDTCRNFVGCHHKTKNRTKPLGVIADRAMKDARVHLHKRIDPLWQRKRITRREIYGRLSAVLGREYHTAELRTLDEARNVYRAIVAIERGLDQA